MCDPECRDDLRSRGDAGLGEWLRSLAVSLLVAWLGCTGAFAATNQATGDVAGDAAALVDSNVITLNSTGNQLALVKRAYLPDGTRVPTTSTLPKGSELVFLIYVSNDSTVAVNDVSVRDVLDPAFAYVTGTIRVDNTVANCAAPVCTPGEEDAIFAVVEPKAPLTDAVDGDVASHVGGTIDAGDENQANLRLDIAALRVWALAFTVTIP